MAEETHTFLVLGKLSAKGIEEFSKDPKKFAEELKKLIEQEEGVKVLEMCALLGDYDGAMKVEAPNEVVLARALVRANKEGLVHTTTYTAISLDKL